MLLFYSVFRGTKSLVKKRKGVDICAVGTTQIEFLFILLNLLSSNLGICTQ